MSTADKIAEHAGSACVGAFAFMMGDVTDGAALTVTSMLGFAALARALRGQCATTLCATASARALTALRASPEFARADTLRAEFLLTRADITPLRPADLIALAAGARGFDLRTPMTDRLMATLPLDGDDAATVAVVRLALEAAVSACVIDEAFRAEMSSVLLIKLVRDAGLQERLMTAMDAKLDRLIGQMERAIRELALKEGLVIGIARRIAEGVDDFDTALRELERALGVAARMEREGALPSNTGDPVQRVLQEVNRLNDAQQLDAAADVVADAFDRIEAERARMIDIGIEQDILRRAPDSAAVWLVRKAALTAGGGALFDALRALQGDWFARGRDKGLAFDLQVSIALAEHSRSRAQGADQRGAALNDLAVALSTLGEREPGTARLEQAVAAYRDALSEWTRDRVPLDWASTQGNLANLDIAWFDKTADPARLAAARAHAMAAREVFAAAGAGQYVGMTDNILAGIIAREAP